MARLPLPSLTQRDLVDSSTHLMFHNPHLRDLEETNTSQSPSLRKSQLILEDFLAIRRRKNPVTALSILLEKDPSSDLLLSTNPNPRESARP
jgi:hypothetical protein